MCILKLTKLRSHSHITEGLISVHWAPAVSCSSTVLSKTEALILWPPDARNWLIGKDPDAGKDWRQEEKWMTEDEIVGWHHWLDGHEFEQALGVGDGQGSLTSCSPWGHKESDTTEQLNWPELIVLLEIVPLGVNTLCFFVFVLFFYIYVSFKPTMIYPFSGDSSQYSYRL